MYRRAEPSDFRCGRYPAAWNPARLVTSVAASKRFEIIADSASTIVRNTNSPAEALRLGRLYAATGASVYVRDRSRRRGYLTEIELERLSDG
jgi:hypothetical protein